MYKCEVHGVLSCRWCDECGKEVECDHSDQTWCNGYIETIKGLSEVEVLCCETCGMDIDVRLK